MKIVHRFSGIRQKHPQGSAVSITIPNQAPSLSYIIQQVNQGRPVPVVQMRADNDVTLDSEDSRYLDPKFMTSEEIQAVLDSVELQKGLLESSKLASTTNADQPSTEKPVVSGDA